MSPHSLCHRRRNRGFEPAMPIHASKVVFWDSKNFNTFTLLNSHVSKTVASTK